MGFVAIPRGSQKRVSFQEPCGDSRVCTNIGALPVPVHVAVPVLSYSACFASQSNLQRCTGRWSSEGGCNVAQDGGAVKVVRQRDQLETRLAAGGAPTCAPSARDTPCCCWCQLQLCMHGEFDRRSYTRRLHPTVRCRHAQRTGEKIWR
jgi:hypothetical protein